MRHRARQRIESARAEARPWGLRAGFRGICYDRGVALPGAVARARHLPRISMELHPGSRYHVLATLADVEGRRVLRARDRLTGVDVVLKLDVSGDLLGEARILRALPAGVGPEPLELFPGPDGAVLAMALVPGQPLHEIAGSGAGGEAVGWLAGLATALERAHRAGVVHGDLKPGNVLVHREDGASQVRLVDFGFATTRFPGDSERRSAPRGGTPEYLSPEVLRGWEPDGRADQYAFGVLAAKLLPDRPAGADAALAKMTAPVPARRFPSMREAWRTLSLALGQPSDCDVRPELRGPLVGRRHALEAARDAALRGDLAVRARPGVGLTRFLRELEELAIGDGIPLVTLDLGLPDLSPAVLAEIADAVEAGSARVVWGLPDLSPGLTWLPGPVAEAARERVAGLETLELEPLSADRFEDLVFAALPSVPEGLGRALHRRSEGDLHVAARELGEVVGRFLPVDAPPAKLDVRRAREDLLARAPVELPPRRGSVSDLEEALAAAGVAGEGTPRTLVEEVFRETGHAAGFAHLVAAGIVRVDTDDRIVFVTRQWARRAQEAAGGAPLDLAARLHELHRPDLDCAADVESAVRRARWLGEDASAQELLQEALQAATREERTADLRRLALGDAAVPAPGAVADTVHELTAAAGGTEAESAMWLGRAIVETDPAAGRAMLQLAAEDPGEAGARAAVALARLALVKGDATELEKRLARIRADEASVLPEGTADTLRAWQALREERRDDARSLARKAQETLAGTGSPMEASCAQVLAAADAKRDPAAATEVLEGALASCRAPRQRIQMLTNLAVLWLRHDPARAVERVDEALALLRVAPHEDAEGRLRLNRASALFARGLVAECRAESERLLTRRVVAAVPSRVVAVRTLLATCLLAVGRGPEAIAQCLAAVRAAAPDDEMSRGNALSAWVEAVVDLGALTRIEEMAERTVLDPDVLGAGHPVAGRRLASLLAWADGDLPRADAALLDLGEEILARATVSDRLGFWAQLARIRLEAAADPVALDEAAARLRDEKSASERDSSYPRVRARLLRSRLAEAAGRPDEADRLLHDAVAAARERGWKRLLAEGLRLRARRAVRSKEETSS